MFTLANPQDQVKFDKLKSFAIMGIKNTLQRGLTHPDNLVFRMGVVTVVRDEKLPNVLVLCIHDAKEYYEINTLQALEAFTERLLEAVVANAV